MRKKLLSFLSSFFLLSLFFGLFSAQQSFANYTWQELNVNGAAGVPAQRSSNTSSAWDSDNNRWMIFGGNNAAASAYFNDLWQYSSSGGWQQLTAQGDPTAPVARTNMAVAWDTQAHRLLMFGGFYNYGTTLNDLWQYTDANGWQQLTAQNDPNSPGTRDDTTAVWDSTNNRLLVFGGLAYIGDYHLYNDLWQYTTAGGWQQLTPDANPNAPTGRISHGAAWDTQNNRMLVFGGDTNSGGVRGSNDLWEYTDANGWQLVTAEDAAGSPPVRERGTVTWDSTNNRLLAFGGRLSNTPSLFNDLWQYTATGGWSQLTADGAAGSPQQRGDQTMAWDTQNHRVLIFAGYNGVGELNDLWAYQNPPNVAPVISTIPNASLDQFTTYSYTGSFSDADSSSWTATVNYGDGTGVQPLALTGTTFSLSHLYNVSGTFPVTVNVTDNQGLTGSKTATLTVFPIPTDKNQCKNNGWKLFTSLHFKNQGECVSWVNHH